MVTFIVQLALLISLLLSGCISTTHPPPISLPTNSPSERVAAVENHIQVKEWFQWTEKTIDGHNLPGYRSLLVMMPEKEQGIAIMVNGEKGNGLILEIFYRFAQAYGWLRS